MARTARNLADLPTSSPMRPRTGRRFRTGLVEGTQDATRDLGTLARHQDRYAGEFALRAWTQR
jgi:hypothetical protein